MIDRREIKRISRKVGKFLDPLALTLLVSLFILPTLAVVNLSPSYKNTSNVLGAQSKKSLSIVMVGGVHDFLKDERLDLDDTSSIYTTNMIKHETGTYSKPIVQISNSFDSDQSIKIEGGATTPMLGSKISIIVNEKEYEIQNENGFTTLAKVNIPSNTKQLVYLKVASMLPIRFNQDIELKISQ